MSTRKFYAAAVLLGLASTGCTPPPNGTATLPAPASESGPEPDAHDALVQYSLITSLAAGDYADGTPLRDMLADGDFGIGTFDQLAGELILLDGKVFQALADGSVRPADMTGSTPFSAVTFFKEDGRLPDVHVTTLQHLDELLDTSLPRRNSPYAIRIDGQFDRVTLRSVPAQSEPYPPLVDVVKKQSVWDRSNVKGTMIGFRCPSWVGTLNVPGYHWHFLSDDQTVGGHVLGCEFKAATVQYDECDSLLVRVPKSRKFDAFNADEIKKQDINTIERQRTGTEK